MDNKNIKQISNLIGKLPKDWNDHSSKRILMNK
jgi:hypothetical protein